jgi:hypothetical protein
MNDQFREEITKAAQGASLLLGDLQAANHHAATADSVAGQLAHLLLLDAIADARKMADRIKAIQEVA